MTCLNENVVVELVEGLLEPEDRERVHAHLQECAGCRQLVSAVARQVDLAIGSPSSGSVTGWPAAAVTDWLPRGTTLDRYVILEQVGAGSAGTVYSAYDPDLDRRVALKLLRAPPAAAAAGEVEGEDLRAALLREARVMARLSHPNVIAVHDVGATDSGVFVAMEFVSGSTLREWEDARARAWPEIRDVFLAAGRGLAAAHGGGLVHRDFKPDNVLIGHDGRVRVTDFGLARLIATAGDPAEQVDVASAPPGYEAPEPGALWRLTRTGSIVGTPAYMAPEQHLGRPADAVSDQFSFCVALYEAVYGERPFEGHTLELLRDAVVQGRVRSAGPRRGTPAALARTLERGLAVDPAARFPSMDALLDDLADGRRERRRRVAVAVGLASAVIATAVAWALRTDGAAASVCTGAESHLASIWSPARERAVEGAFSATGVVYADAAWTRVDRLVSGYADGWIAAHTEACRATRVLGEQSEAALDLRMQCLAARRRELGALVDLFAAADPAVVEKAVQAAHSLRPVTDCADLDALAQPVARPSAPATSSRLDELEGALARAGALGEAGRWREALAAARPIATRARELGHAPFLAEVLVEIGRYEDLTGDDAAAERTLKDAILAADAGHDDARRAEALILATNVIGTPTRLEEGAALVEHADAIVGRLRDRRLVAGVARAKGRLAYAGGRIEESRRQLERALTEDLARLGPDDPRLTSALNALGDADERMGDFEAAQRHLDRARSIAEKTLGPEHPTTATTYEKLANLANSRGRMEEALRLYDRVVELRLRIMGEQHKDTAYTLRDRGHTLGGLGRLDEATADFTRALRIARSLESPDEELQASCLDGLGSVARDQRRYDEAIDLHRQALAIRERRGDRRNIAPAHYSLGSSLLEKGEIGPALVHLRQAVAIWESFLGPDHVHVAYGLDGIGVALLKAGRVREAIAPLERAYRIRGGATAPWSAETAMSLARALWRARRDPRAIELMREAAGFWRTSPRFAAQLATTEAWLASHRPPRPREQR